MNRMVLDFIIAGGPLSPEAAAEVSEWIRKDREARAKAAREQLERNIDPDDVDLVISSSRWSPEIIADVADFFRQCDDTTKPTTGGMSSEFGSVG